MLSAKTAPAAIAALSSSRMVGRHAPTAFTCMPGSSQSPSSTGAAELVAVTTMPAPATASGTVAQASTGTPVCPARLAARRPAFSWSRPTSRTSASGRDRLSASTCARACTPVPMTASTAASGLASRAVATTDIAAVLISVTAEAFSSASGSPVRPLDSSTTPWWVSRPAAGFAAVMQMALSPYAPDCSPSR